jgi:hypothetical protein
MFLSGAASQFLTKQPQLNKPHPNLITHHTTQPTHARPCSYVVGSLLYFERALVVSRSLTGPGDRTTFFAWLNSWSAGLIALCQLFATASVLRAIGVPAALALGPGVCLAGLAAIAWRVRRAAAVLLVEAEERVERKGFLILPLHRKYRQM